MRLVETACSRCCCCSACHCLFALFALCTVCMCIFCMCVVYDVQRRLVLRGCLRKYLQQLIAKSAAMPTHQLPASLPPCNTHTRPQPSRLAASCPSALPQHKALDATSPPAKASAPFTFALFTFPHPLPRARVAHICQMVHAFATRVNNNNSNYKD